MRSLRLKKIIKKDTAAVIQALIQATDPHIFIQDTSGKVLLGETSETAQKYPITLEEEVLGWACGSDRAAVVARMITHLADREFEKRALTTETLERYKEINLLYTVAAKMASCLDPQEIATLVLAEIRKIITTSSASVMLFHEADSTLETIAAWGAAVPDRVAVTFGEGVAGRVLQTGKGVVLNDVHDPPEYFEQPQSVGSLICTPLNVEEKTIGLVNIIADQAVTYTAGDLKLASALTSQAAVSIENARLQAERLERQKIVQELEIARNIQLSMLPETTPTVAGAEVTAAFLPARQVGGDFYDFIPISDHRLGIVIADVSGKGVPAALFMALSQALMRANALQNAGVAEAVLQTNRLILECAHVDLFVTLFYAILDTRACTLRYVCAGHNPPFLYRQQTGKIELLEADGIALGVLDEIELEEREVRLEAGDVIAFYTDGVTEMNNEHEEEFGEDRLMQLMTKHHTMSAHDLIENIKEVIMAFAGTTPQFDDFTLTVVKMV